MIETTEAAPQAFLAAAREGDQHAFESLIAPYRRELLVHCYRFLGSLEDAEDTLQEALLRAWRGLASFEGRSTLRAWLYKITTNTALDALRGRPRRLLPIDTHLPANPGEPVPENPAEPWWLEPLPDTLIDQSTMSDPAARYDAHESVEIAFLIVLQNLPGRQRAVLILRDVLGWKANEVAALLDTSVPAVNSALQRARATVSRLRPDSAPDPTTGAELSDLLARYVAAWESADSAKLVALLHEDAVLTMPPLPEWYFGRSAIRWFLESRLFGEDSGGRFRLVPARANGSPAFAVYERDEKGDYRCAAIQVLAISAGRIVQVHDFLTPGARLLSRFALPGVL